MFLGEKYFSAWRLSILGICLAFSGCGRGPSVGGTHPGVVTDSASSTNLQPNPSSSTAGTPGSTPLEGDGKGFGGGDTLYDSLRQAQNTLLFKIEAIQNGYLNQTPPSPSLSPDQLNYVKSFVIEVLPQLQGWAVKTTSDVFSISNDPLSVTGLNGLPMVVIAKTAFGPLGTIQLYGRDARVLSQNTLTALVIHEICHKVRFQNAYLTDNDPIGPFSGPGGGRVLLDATADYLANYLSSPPDIVGTWYINTLKCSVTRNGNTFYFINERNETSVGYGLSNYQFVATDWNHLNATLSADGQTLSWGNNTIWSRKPLTVPDLNGVWYIGSLKCSITQQNGGLTFVNERGAVSRGEFVSSNALAALDWGNLRANLSNDSRTIYWANQTVWTRVKSP